MLLRETGRCRSDLVLRKVNRRRGTTDWQHRPRITRVVQIVEKWGFL
jgi:hypothetical protein